jgi:hypothetical protein
MLLPCFGCGAPPKLHADVTVREGRSAHGIMTRPKCQSFAEKFPEHELAVRRLILRDGDFCSVCENHEACVAAVRHWEAQGNQVRAGEYRRLSLEIEEEILGFLSRSASEAHQMATAPGRHAGTKN